MTMQKLELDSHKLRYHPRLVADFIEGKDITPLNAEVSLTDGCNHRCLFCNFNYLGHKRVSLPEGRMPKLVGELRRAGVRTVTFAGAGEPLLHPDLFPSLTLSKRIGLEAALSTNGVHFTPDQLSIAADTLTWIRFSINGGSPESYATVHRSGAGDFTRALNNIASLSMQKQKHGSIMTLGTQCVLLPENHKDIVALGKRLRDTGADYFTVKHYYPREEGDLAPDMSFRTNAYLEELHAAARELTTNGFTMTVRSADKLDRTRPYHQCRALPFFVYIRENGLLYTCFSHQEDAATAIGNLLEHDFPTLWNSPEKAKAIAHINASYRKNDCQANCRHHQMNLYLHDLAHPPEHVNFL